MDSRIELLLRVIDEAFDHKSWHGTNLRGALRGLSIHELMWRPQPERHNVWEITLHAAYWKYTVRRRLLNEKRGSFDLKGSNWFLRPVDDSPHEKQWKSDLSLLLETHSSLRNAVANLDPEKLHRKADSGTTTFLSLITGIAAHDHYHAGQIQLLKRLYHSEVAKSSRSNGTRRKALREA
ncbi:MAG: DinB family protein [Planctomycetaceae bacterium]|nr:DinB family protein [Planctomycetaceae bacterium]